MKRILVAAVVGLCVVPSQAAAWRVPLPAAPIEWHIGQQCPGAVEAGCAWRDGDHAVIYVAAGWITNQIAWHELGHAFDYFNMTDARRDAWRSIMHDPRPWRTSPNSPHEQFAESYMACALGQRRSLSYGYLYAPTRAQFGQVCALIRSA